jgi:hypothetical protein
VYLTEPGRKHGYYFRYCNFNELTRKYQDAQYIFPMEVEVEDEIGNVYREPIPDNFRADLLKYIRH